MNYAPIWINGVKCTWIKAHSKLCLPIKINGSICIHILLKSEQWKSSNGIEIPFSKLLLFTVPSPQYFSLSLIFRVLFIFFLFHFIFAQFCLVFCCVHVVWCFLHFLMVSLKRFVWFCCVIFLGIRCSHCWHWCSRNANKLRKATFQRRRRRHLHRAQMERQMVNRIRLQKIFKRSFKCWKKKIDHS